MMKIKNYLWTNACCINQSYIWFVYNPCNVLMRCDMRTGIVEIVKKLPDCKVNPFSYYDIVSCGRKLFIIPGNEKNIVVYDIENTEIRLIELSDLSGAYFRKAFVINNKIYLVPANYPEFLQIDSDTLCVKEILDWKKLLKKDKDITDTALIDDKVIVSTIYDTNSLLVVNLIDCKSEICEIKGNIKLGGIASFNGKLYLNDTSSGDLIIYDIMSRQIENVFDGFINKNNYRMSNLCGNRLILDNSEILGERLIIDCNNEIVEEEKVDVSSVGCPYFSCACCNEPANPTMSYLFDFSSGSIKKYNEGVLENEVYMALEEEGKEDLIDIYTSNQLLLNEMGLFSIYDFLRCVGAERI